MNKTYFLETNGRPVGHTWPTPGPLASNSETVACVRTNEELVKMRGARQGVLIQQIWGRAREFTFLTSPT